jgi:hypothetical protein
MNYTKKDIDYAVNLREHSVRSDILVNLEKYFKKQGIESTTAAEKIKDIVIGGKK